MGPLKQQQCQPVLLLAPPLNHSKALRRCLRVLQLSHHRPPQALHPRQTGGRQLPCLHPMTLMTLQMIGPGRA